MAGAASSGVSAAGSGWKKLADPPACGRQISRAPLPGASWNRRIQLTPARRSGTGCLGHRDRDPPFAAVGFPAVRGQHVVEDKDIVPLPVEPDRGRTLTVPQVLA